MASFIGSFHCFLMCGPFAGYYAVGSRGVSLSGVAFYQVGRLISYSALGLAAGLLGKGFLYVGQTMLFQRFLMIATGVAMIGLGIWQLVRPGATPFRGLMRHVARLKQPLVALPKGPLLGLLLGLLSTLLPCGYLYSFVFAAAATGTPLGAVSVMVAFWLGTVPAMMTVALGTDLAARRFLGRASRLTPVFLIVVGLLAVLGKWLTFPELGATEGPLCFTP
nr:sulfite exporter TauE/SafE family protein [Acanthopleuribacter pedis]